ncbi:hypothetical protein NECAME_17732 [Necator americanus]|uniref:Uncharacterized protein n=1 Tax=Necator americanus TaxID=51031 RepID=W2TL83_NECAM|nr:hypothetical protein NECAME_17732 [Necator americanus]ETN82389.1 hypothetical protein NECAME_17732 [Necator americanus]
MHATRVGRVAHRAANVGAERDRPDACRDRGRRAAARTTRRERRIARVFRVPVDLIAREPAQREGRRIGAAEQYRARAHEVFDGRAVDLRDQILLQTRAVGRGEARLVDVDLRGDGHARERPRVFAARNRRVDLVGLLEDPFGPVVDHRVDQRIDGFEPLERGLRRLACRHFARANPPGEFSCG